MPHWQSTPHASIPGGVQCPGQKQHGSGMYGSSVSLQGVCGTAVSSARHIHNSGAACCRLRLWRTMTCTAIMWQVLWASASRSCLVSRVTLEPGSGCRLACILHDLLLADCLHTWLVLDPNALAVQFITPVLLCTDLRYGSFTWQ